VVLRDQAADGDAPVEIHLREADIQDVAADVVEVHVDAAGAGSFQGVGQVFPAVVDGGIEFELLQQPPALFGRSGEGPGATSLDAGDLADQRTDGAGGG